VGANKAYKQMSNTSASLRRLRVTRGLCLPADVAFHAVCSSKDVIHSWAIPGLGIKIDCIPGYNSHRRVLLR
jgi:heme/copper-type cytochrome/quinol oxidase subunit 2